MGKRGPAPTPAHILAIRGSSLAKNRSDAPAVEGQPDCPEWLQGAARDEWDRLCADLAERGLLSTTDRPTIAMLAVAWSDYIAADEHIRTEGAVVENTRGVASVSAWVRIRRDASDIIMRLSAQFGLTPSARIGLPNSPPQTPEAIASRDRKSRFFQTGNDDAFEEFIQSG